MKHSQILKLNRSSAINQAQWDELLLAILFGEDEGNVTEDIEAIASVDDSSMTIIIQKKIEGITVRTLGTCPPSLISSLIRFSLNMEKYLYLLLKMRKYQFLTGADLRRSRGTSHGTSCSI